MSIRACQSVSALGFATAVAALALVSLQAAPARACSPIQCSGPRVFPRAGDIPANLFQLTFERSINHNPSPDAGVPEGPRLYRIDGDVRTEVTLQMQDKLYRTVELTVAEPFAEGTRLVLEAGSYDCYESVPLKTEFVITQARALPASLGSLVVAYNRAPLVVPVSSGTCVDTVDAAYADVHIELTSDAVPFADVLALQLVVDGKSAGLVGPSMGLGSTRLYAACAHEKYTSPQGDTPPGVHSVLMRGTLPNGVVIETPAIQLELSCGKGDAGVAMQHDAAVSGGGSVFWDASSSPDASMSPASNPGLDDSSDEGCSLSADSGPLASWMGWLVVGLVARRKRKFSGEQTRRQT